MRNYVSTDRPKHKGTRILGTLLALLMFSALTNFPAQAASGQSLPAPVSLTMTVGESVTLSNVPNTLGFTYPAGGGSTNIQSFAVTTSWQLASTRTALHLVFYFANATALNLGTTVIPTSQFFLDNTATPTHACSDNTGDPLVPASQGHSGACTFGKSIALGSTFAGTETDTIFAQLQGLASSLPVGSYTGVLIVQAGYN
jgi:hypothetical protein